MVYSTVTISERPLQNAIIDTTESQQHSVFKTSQHREFGMARG